MTVGPADASFYADPQGLSGLRREARAQSPEALRETARQFESLFTRQLLKSMRDATPRDSLFGSDQQDFYQDMFDQQLSTQLSQGRGLGLADLLVRQLMQAPGAPAQAQAATSTGEPGRPGAASGAAAWPPRTREDFVQALQPAAEQVGRELGVDPRTLIAHAALETGWGRSMPTDAEGRCSNNLFGIKAGERWAGGRVNAVTTEFAEGRAVKEAADFRRYDSPEACLRDYARLLGGNPRYAAALGTGSDAAAFGRALQDGGYATDPEYASKLAEVARGLKFPPGLPSNVNGVS